jgi:hypothetical protein
MDNEKTDLEQHFKQCAWCGQWITRKNYEARVARQAQDPDLCRDCRDVKFYKKRTSRHFLHWEHPELGLIKCQLWQGALNDDWMPIDEFGVLVKPGRRVCGLKDCVVIKHIERNEK